MLDRITVHGARQHNLKNIDVEIPRNSFTVITVLSGSGKSSLAFDISYAEGQRPNSLHKAIAPTCSPSSPAELRSRRSSPARAMPRGFVRYPGARRNTALA